MEIGSEWSTGFADVNDLVGTLTTTASIGEEIQLEGAGLNYVSKVYFNGYAVNMTSEIILLLLLFALSFLKKRLWGNRFRM